MYKERLNISLIHKTKKKDKVKYSGKYRFKIKNNSVG